jgi:hypothetical protein
MPMHNQIIITETALANIAAILLLVVLQILLLLLLLIQIIYKKGQTNSRVEKVLSSELLFLEKFRNLHKNN